MASLLFIAPSITVPNCNLCSKIHGSSFRVIANPTLNFLSVSSRPEDHLHFASIHRYQSYSSNEEEEEEESQEGLVQDLRVPEHWLDPSKALEESEWLRITLHKWLDDEYCPEPTNVDISCVAARSYYKSLVERQTDLGEILLKMARELESISYQESFHGAFSSANAAVNLIIQRIEQD
ncbi:hypothetical protein LOK49_LG15G00356 [Camellia lanceoleosa]|uniref:Uncharacterized protein n=1 Tax=Camellia lanceoleosa TaxID=1840588 RepID=A0ACC0F7Q0_9ERIC|nr:hypothetical protein LOK49_LG15G00356 [Camellia lanceoleosa]